MHPAALELQMPFSKPFQGIGYVQYKYRTTIANKRMAANAQQAIQDRSNGRGVTTLTGVRICKASDRFRTAIEGPKRSRRVFPPLSFYNRRRVRKVNSEREGRRKANNPHPQK